MTYPNPNDLTEPTRNAIATGFICFLLGASIVGFVFSLANQDLRRERNEARAVCEGGR